MTRLPVRRIVFPTNNYRGGGQPKCYRSQFTAAASSLGKRQLTTTSLASRSSLLETPSTSAAAGSFKTIPAAAGIRPRPWDSSKVVSSTTPILSMVASRRKPSRHLLASTTTTRTTCDNDYMDCSRQRRTFSTAAKPASENVEEISTETTAMKNGMTGSSTDIQTKSSFAASSTDEQLDEEEDETEYEELTRKALATYRERDANHSFWKSDAYQFRFDRKWIYVHRYAFQRALHQIPLDDFGNTMEKIRHYLEPAAPPTLDDTGLFTDTDRKSTEWESFLQEVDKFEKGLGKSLLFLVPVLCNPCAVCV